MCSKIQRIISRFAEELTDDKKFLEHWIQYCSAAETVKDVKIDEHTVRSERRVVLHFGRSSNNIQHPIVEISKELFQEIRTKQSRAGGDSKWRTHLLANHIRKGGEASVAATNAAIKTWLTATGQQVPSHNIA
ncbi:hypothetical protein AMJ74_02045 [candidate division WOR_3 bacterium SM1_77]|uniref:Uncharacterized protein n=1 Tax=candidate division WOR_3 bacterium SM1_77 TaxID=1703778 RepID=A0A0S8K2H4_UNCW3|nr:MAG: hypothetical protein AMJ74_02045 [candidate division WOR_3 bacterium SM1_77]